MKSIEWLAGLLEGEGCFWNHRIRRGRYYYPAIKLSMCDQDVVVAASAMLNTKVTRQSDPRPNHKDVYTTSLSGVKSLALMLELFPYMGNRRRQKIATILSDWEHSYTGA